MRPSLAMVLAYRLTTNSMPTEAHRPAVGKQMAPSKAACTACAMTNM